MRIIKYPEEIIIDGVEEWSEEGIDGWVKDGKYYLYIAGWQEVEQAQAEIATLKHEVQWQTDQAKMFKDQLYRNQGVPHAE